MKTVLISGAGGFIGGHLARKLKDSGCRTVGVSRKPKSLENFDAVFRGRLLEPIKAVFDQEKIDAFVHCAYHSGGDEFRTNVEGTKRWAEQAKKHGVGRQIFISSISARQGSTSVYGRSKYEVERWFLDNQQVVFRLGLVIGNGGFFRRIAAQVNKWPLLPLIEGGKSLVYFVGIEAVCDAIRDTILSQESPRREMIWNFFQPSPMPLRSVLEEVRKQSGAFCRFIPFPYGFALGTVLLLEKIPFLKLNINSNNIRGLRQNDRLDLSSDFPKFGYPESSPRELIGRMKTGGN